MFFLHWWKISVLNGDPCSNSWSVNHQFRDDFVEKWFSEWFCHRSPSESVSLALRTIFQQNPFRRKHRHLNTLKHKQTHKQAILQQNPLKHWHLHTCRKASLHITFSSNASMMFLIPSERSEFFSNPLVMLRKVSCDAAKSLLWCCEKALPCLWHQRKKIDCSFSSFSSFCSGKN